MRQREIVFWDHLEIVRDELTLEGAEEEGEVVGDGGYAVGFFPEDQVRRIVDFSYSRGMTRYSALAPEDSVVPQPVWAEQQPVSAEQPPVWAEQPALSVA